jgi:hypothetical protein
MDLHRGHRGTLGDRGDPVARIAFGQLMIAMTTRVEPAVASVA